MIRRILLILFLVHGCLFTQAQIESTQFSLSGIITNEKDIPIANGNISLHKTIDSLQVAVTSSDGKGKFGIAIAPGTYFLKISFLSYEEKISTDSGMYFA